MPRNYSKITDPVKRKKLKERDDQKSSEAQAKMNIATNWPSGRKQKAVGSRKSKTGRYTGGGF